LNKRTPADELSVDLDANSDNITTLLVAALAVVAMVFLLRKKYDSNLPLMFYFIALIFTNMSDRSVNPYLMVVGLAFALLLRFEFMNPVFTKLVAGLATAAMGIIVYVFLVEVFGNGQAPF
jgi:mannose/fructose/N-acetylgalactosamine-specific phosphotransferase system component IID